MLDKVDFGGIKDVDHALRALVRQRAILQSRERLMPFVRFVRPDPEDPEDATRSTYKNQPFHDAVAAALEEFVKGTSTKQLIFCMPTRHGKTELAAKSLAAWYHGQNPHHDIAVGTYAGDLATDMGADVRAIITSTNFQQVFPRYQLRKGGKAKDNIVTTERGRMVFKGRGEAMTGRGAHLLILDDLFKDFEEARSQTIRDQAWNWFTKVAMTRRMGKKLVIIIMTRWHTDDVIGRITDPQNPHYSEAEAKKWKIINLPLLAEEDDPLGRPLNEPLWPEEYDLEYAEGLRNLDPLGFAALQQQRPTVADGTLFRRENVRYYGAKDLPDVLRFYGASDHAVGLKQRNDLSCLLRAGVDQQDNIYLTDCVWGRYTTLEVVEFMLEMFRGNMAPLFWWAEKGHITQSIGPFLFKRMAETSTFGNIIECTPIADKQARAQSISARFAMGKVFFPKDAPWVERAVTQLLEFPNGTFDDFVDALSWLGKGLGGMHAPVAPEKPKAEPAYGTLAWVKMYDAHARMVEADAYGDGM